MYCKVNFQALIAHLGVGEMSSFEHKSFPDQAFREIQETLENLSEFFISHFFQIFLGFAWVLRPIRKFCRRETFLRKVYCKENPQFKLFWLVFSLLLHKNPPFSCFTAFLSNCSRNWLKTCSNLPMSKFSLLESLLDRELLHYNSSNS